MAQKWYQKASVQVAMVTVSGAIIVSLITIANQRAELRQNNERLQDEAKNQATELQDLKRERDKLETQLAPFLATAKLKFPDAPPDKRLELLLQKMEQAVSDVRDAARRIGQDRHLSDDLIKKAASKLKGLPKMTVHITALLGDTETFAFAKQLESLFTRAAWPIAGGGVSQAVFSVPQKGCKFVFPQKNIPPSSLQEMFLEILDAIGQEKKLFIDPRLEKGTLKIIIGSK